MTGPARTGPLRRAVPLFRAARDEARRAPLTLSVVALLWGVGLATGSIGHGPGPALLRAVAISAGSAGLEPWWSPATALAWCSGAVSYTLTTVALLALCAPAERRLGTRRTALVVIVTQTVGVIAVGSAVRSGVWIGPGWSQQLAAQLAVGPSTVAAGVSLAWTARMDLLRRRRTRVLLLVALSVLALYSGSLQDVLRASVGLTGLLLGPALLGRNPPTAAPVSQEAENRLLVAMLVAASAVGPLVAVLSGTSIGPLSVLRFLFTSPPPDAAGLRAVCLESMLAEDCVALRQQLRLAGAGPAFMSVMPVLLMLVTAEGLRRGRRFGWWAAFVLNGLLSALGLVAAVGAVTASQHQFLAFEGLDDGRYRILAILPLVQPLLVVVLLLTTYRIFDAATPRSAYRRLAVRLTSALGAVSALYIGGGLLVRTQFDYPPRPAALLADLPLRLMPTGYLGELEASFLPTRPAATVLYEWCGPAFWMCAIAAATATLLATKPHRGNTDTARIRALLHTGTASPLAHMTTWDGNSYWLHPNGETAFAYRVIGRVALTTGDPLGRASAHESALADFFAYCSRNTWTPCLYSITQTTAALADRLGWRTIQVAEEASVPLAGLTFTGRAWQDVRTALNHARRHGVNAQWIKYPYAPSRLVDQIKAISQEWLDDKQMPQLGFTLGGIEELTDEHVRCILAVDAHERVHAVASWLPVYRDSTAIGWTLDLTRRRRDAFPGATEFLIASAIKQFQSEGALLVSLSGAPLARQGRAAHGTAPAAQWVLDRIGQTLEPIYGFRSLLAFKAKFQPVYHPLFMAYTDPTALPGITTAICRAYLPNLTTTQASLLLLRLLRRTTKHPADR